jgi:hypothetical protein
MNSRFVSTPPANYQQLICWILQWFPALTALQAGCLKLCLQDKPLPNFAKKVRKRIEQKAEDDLHPLVRRGTLRKVSFPFSYPKFFHPFHVELASPFPIAVLEAEDVVTRHDLREHAWHPGAADPDAENISRLLLCEYGFDPWGFGVLPRIYPTPDGQHIDVLEALYGGGVQDSKTTCFLLPEDARRTFLLEFDKSAGLYRAEQFGSRVELPQASADATELRAQVYNCFISLVKPALVWWGPLLEHWLLAEVRYDKSPWWADLFSPLWLDKDPHPYFFCNLASLHEPSFVAGYGVREPEEITALHKHCKSNNVGFRLA